MSKIINFKNGRLRVIKIPETVVFNDNNVEDVDGKEIILNYPYDLSKGRIIAGTGTIDINGNVGSISGIKYKIKGAKNSDIFFVPIDNYEEAKEVVNKNKYNMILVPVKNFKDAVTYLNK